MAIKKQRRVRTALVKGEICVGCEVEKGQVRLDMREGQRLGQDRRVEEDEKTDRR